MKKIIKVAALSLAVAAFLAPTSTHASGAASPCSLQRMHGLVSSALPVRWIEGESPQGDPTGGSYSSAPLLIQLAGSEETVWLNDHGAEPGGHGSQCEWSDTPDQPAIGIRDHRGQINIFGGGWGTSFKMIGQNFSVNPAVPGHLSRSCEGIFTSGFKLPGGWIYENFRNHDWISGLYADEEAGHLIYGLLQNEYWGASSPQWGSACGHCPPAAGAAAPCWINSVTVARSTDGGDYFRRGGFQYVPTGEVNPFKAEVIAKIINTYVPCQSRAGYFSPTNIMRVGGPQMGGYRFLSMVEADSTLSPELSSQVSGMSVLQCGFMSFDNSIVPDGSWRAWGGQNFDRDLAQGDVAEVVGEPQLRGLKIKSLFYLNDLETFIGLGARVDTGGTGNIAIFYSFSKDLINWSPRQKLIDSEAKQGMKGVTLYPSLINHGAETHNLSNGRSSGTQIHLYMVRRLSNSAVNHIHRKLSRIRVRILVP